MFVCFTGIDGSGKSTLAKRLVDILRRKGARAELVRGAYSLWALRPLVGLGKAMFLTHKDAFDNYTEYYASIREASRNSVLARTYQDLTLAEYFFQILLKIKIPLMMGKDIVCDRYVYDTMTDFAVNLGYPDEWLRSSLKRFLHYCPEPDTIFLVDIPEEVAYQRKSDIPSIDYLRRRRGFYLAIAKDYGMIELDGCKDLAVLEHVMQDSVEKDLPKE